jgi:hypothetical protein
MKKAFTLMKLIIVTDILAVILWTSYIFRDNSENEKSQILTRMFKIHFSRNYKSR